MFEVMKITKKMLCALLCLVTVLLPLAGCGASSDNTPAGNDTAAAVEETETAAAETTKETAVADVPDETYNGYKFRMLQRNHSSMATNKCWAFTVESEDGETINDAMYKLRILIEDRFDISVSQILADDPQSTASSAILAGDDSFDALQTLQSQAYGLAKNHMLVPLNEVPYIDLDAKWWNRNLSKELTIKGNLYYNTGDITLADDILAFCIFFNKMMWKNYELESPYEMVENGEWTLERLGSMVTVANKDLNGDGVLDSEDQWGMQSELAAGNYLYFGSGEYMVTNTGDSFKITLDSERSVSMVEKVMSLLCSDDIMIADHIVPKDGSSPFAYAKTMFMTDRLMLRTSTFEPLLALRDMDADYGVLPIPKYDEAQEVYRSGANRSIYVVGVPVTQTDLERTGVILESYAAESRNILNPAFYDVALQGKVLRDNDSEAMLDIIFNNQVFDIGHMFDIGGFSLILSDMINSGSNTLSSRLASIRSSAEAALEKALADF